MQRAFTLWVAPILATVAASAVSCRAFLPSCDAADERMTTRNEGKRVEAIRSALSRSCRGGVEVAPENMNERFIADTLKTMRRAHDPPFVFRDAPADGGSGTRSIDPSRDEILRRVANIAERAGVTEITQIDGKRWIAWVERACTGCDSGSGVSVVLFRCPGNRVGILHVAAANDPNEWIRCRADHPERTQPCDGFCETRITRLDAARIDDVDDLGTAVYSTGHLQPAYESSTSGGGS